MIFLLVWFFLFYFIFNDCMQVWKSTFLSSSLFQNLSFFPSKNYRHGRENIVCVCTLAILFFLFQTLTLAGVWLILFLFSFLWLLIFFFGLIQIFVISLFFQLRWRVAGVCLCRYIACSSIMYWKWDPSPSSLPWMHDRQCAVRKKKKQNQIYQLRLH